MIVGTCTDATPVVRAVTGTVTDKGISFSHPSVYDGSDLTTTFAGTLDTTGKLNGTIDVQPLNDQGTFSAAKTAPKP